MATNTKSARNRIHINVSGGHFETHRSTLELYPHTLLGNRKRLKPYYDKVHDEYFFDRHQASFHSILYYYQSQGRLRRPQSVPLDTFLEEVTFFELGLQALQQVRNDENVKETRKIRLPRNRLRRHMWANMEYPEYSISAKIFNFVSMCMILLSCIALAVETLPEYNGLYDNICQIEHERLINQSLKLNLTKISYPICAALFYSPFFIIQTIAVSFFTLEFLVRIISTPSYCDFVKSILNWIDLIAIIPYYITVAITLTDTQNDIDTSSYAGLRLLRMLRFTRVFKVYRIFRHFKTLRVLAAATRESLPDFLIMIAILTLLSFLFGAATYLAENAENGVVFDSIPRATYWGIITITSTGYGDMYPITAAGRVLACLCAFSGTATVGMLASVLVDRYQRVYTRKLYTKENVDEIEFDNYSDDDDRANSDLESEWHNQLKNNVKAADPDARARKEESPRKYNDKESDGFDENPCDVKDESEEMLSNANEKGLIKKNLRACFSITYMADDPENDDPSEEIIERISEMVNEKRLGGTNISLSLIKSNDNGQQTPKFKLESPISNESFPVTTQQRATGRHSLSAYISQESNGLSH
ncbi:unnamed protein product [Didymodactylos carnosus]|uniref:BTB domain-containing protein n=1 Tax=Didymodactylos carnosus TaxID=1234261 RepID=A0A814W027_9BILA|nr:unnamed protein product [Didymodactylos carnosus]CAF1198257.1 unnamed protein product [Didymodactylos carnosus]CAF3866785.1 unnamed protein product [Didymodactylos carnosus]CAF3962627.1 unnamed protein product [Didymodactylos carnosus]